MAKKILVALDESSNSMKAVEYVAKRFQPDTVITLLSVIPDAASGCELDGPSLTPSFEQNKKTFCSLEDTKKMRVKAFMEKAKQVLVKAGFASKDVAVRVRKKKAGIARDVIAEAQKGQYDTLVVGRRGFTGVKRFLFGSVSNKIVQGAEGVSVVVVD
jgi:nucleotide-binding universal stress UspA family protein